MYLPLQPFVVLLIYCSMPLHPPLRDPDDFSTSSVSLKPSYVHAYAMG